MKFKILEALIERDALAVGDELFGYDVTLINVVNALKFASEVEPAVAGEEVIEAVYNEIAKGILGEGYGEA